jgi:hypothetical protein
MLLGPCPLSCHSCVAVLEGLPPLVPQVVGLLLQQGVLQLVVLPQVDLLLVLLCQWVGLPLLPVGQELAVVVVVVAPFLR